MRPDKSFIKKEYERERSLRPKPAVKETNTKSTKSTNTPTALRFEHIMTPNEMRASLGFPTISDEPQCVIIEKGE